MAYNPTTWVGGAGGTEVTAARLNNIETGVDAVDAALEAFQTDVVASLNAIILYYANVGALPATGVTNRLYITIDNNKAYRWTGSAYVEVSPMVFASSGTTQTGTSTTEAVTPAGLQSRVATALNSTAVSARLLEVGLLATALGHWIMPVTYNTTTSSWPARNTVVPSWYTGPALYQAISTTDVPAPSDAVTGDLLEDLYAT